MNASSKQTDSYLARLFECGASRVATIVGVSAWLQESAASHARALGFSNQIMIDSGVVWVLSRMCVRMDAYPKAGDTTFIKTWPAALEKKRAFRDFSITNAEGQRIGVATTAWTALNLETRRLGSFPPAVTESYPALGERSCDFTGRAIPRLREPQHEVSIIARRSDIDENGHVNNVRLIEWALEAIPDDQSHQHPRVLDIAFRAEVPPKTTVTVACNHGGDNSLHSIIREDGTEAVRMLCQW